jgi:hypothetical protein
MIRALIPVKCLPTPAVLVLFMYKTNFVIPHIKRVINSQPAPNRLQTAGTIEFTAWPQANADNVCVYVGYISCHI